MTHEQIMTIYSALESAEKRLLAANKDRPIDPIRQALDQLAEARQILSEQIREESGQTHVA
jgi:hypothetical protein